MMRTVPLGSSGLSVPNVVAGMMRIDDKTDAEVRALYQASRDAGIDFFDHADIYARSLHSAEERFAQALSLSGAERAEIRLQTKAGIVREGPYFDFSYEHLVSSVEGSLRALRTDYVDVLLLHRPDALVEPDEVARAFDHLEESGKVRAFGVSNHTPRQIDLLRTAVRQPIVANQVQLSIAHAPVVAQGLAANMETPPNPPFSTAAASSSTAASRASRSRRGPPCREHAAGAGSSSVIPSTRSSIG